MNREVAAGHSGLLRRTSNSDPAPASEIYLGGLEPASYYQFCVRAYPNLDFYATEYQCVDGFTAPTTAQAPPPVDVLFLECRNDRVVAAWDPPLILPGAPALSRFDYDWAGDAAGSVPAPAPLQPSYSAMTDIHQAGDAVEFSVRAIYQVGTETDDYSFYTSEAARVGGDPCTVPDLTEPTADLWLMLDGVRSDTGVVVPVGAEVLLMWRTTGADDGDIQLLIRDRNNLTSFLSSDPINLQGLPQISSAGVTRDYILNTRNTGGDTAVDSVSVTWEQEDDPIWDRTVTVILIIKDIPKPALTVVCANGALTASWTIDIAEGLTLTGFIYYILFAEVDEIGEIEGVLGPDARSISIPGSAEVITLVLTAVYTGADGTTGLLGPKAQARCGVPGSPSDLTLDCVPGVGDAAVATARWTPTPPVDGFTFVRYEYAWFFTDHPLMSRTGDPITDVTVSMVSSQDGDYRQGDLAHFILTAFFLNTLVDPAAPVSSHTLTITVFCDLATPTPTHTRVPTPTYTPTPTPTPTPRPLLPLIEPQLVYFDPTLPPTLVQNGRFISQIQSHHVVLVISQPYGHVALDTDCPTQDNIRRVDNGEVITFTGCDLVNESHPNPNGNIEAEIVVLWPKDGQTVLFQHWIQVRAKRW